MANGNKLETNRLAAAVATTGFSRVNRIRLLSVLAGIALAVALLLSPLAVCALPVIAVIIGLAGRGLDGSERKLVLGVLGLATALRIALIAGLFLSSDPVNQGLSSFPFDLDGLFMKTRALWMRNVWLGIPVEPRLFRLTYDIYGWTSYVEVIAYLQWLFGEAPYAIHLFNVCVNLVGAVLIHRTVRASFGPLPALLTLAVTLFVPTLVMWSSSALKESLYFMLTAAIVYGLARLPRERRAIDWLWCVLLVAASTGALKTVRTGAWIFPAAGFVVAYVGMFLSRRIVLCVGLAVLTVVFGGRVLAQPRIRLAVMTQLATAADMHRGHTRSGGHSYKLLDERFYSSDQHMYIQATSITWPELERFVVRAALSFVFIPLPWQMASTTELAFAPEQLLWYCLLLFAVPGVLEGLRRDAFVTWVLVGFIVVSGAGIALNIGNVGTLIRFRGSLVPFVACLGSLGVVSVLAGLRPGKERSAMARA